VPGSPDWISDVSAIPPLAPLFVSQHSFLTLLRTLWYESLHVALHGGGRGKAVEFTQPRRSPRRHDKYSLGEVASNPSSKSETKRTINPHASFHVHIYECPSSWSLSPIGMRMFQGKDLDPWLRILSRTWYQKNESFIRVFSS